MFHVFVEGPADASPAATAQLAAAMARHYGLPEADLRARLERGRFRVKANVDRATAATYQRDLEALGARVVIERAEAPPGPAVSRTATPLPPGPAISRTMTPLPPADPARPSAASMASGLAAAFTQDARPADLGALDSAGFSLASLDGSEAEPASAGGFAPPDDAPLPASIGPAATTPPAPAAPKQPQADGPVDLFAPPDAGDQELAVDLATDELEERARKRATAPPATEPVIPAGRASSPALRLPAAATAPPVTSVASRLSPRARLAAGVALAIVLGFVPAHFVAASREAAAFKAIDAALVQRYAAADTPGAYAELDRHYNDARDAKKRERRSIALTSMLIWAAAGGAIAYVWFRRIPWQ